MSFKFFTFFSFLSHFVVHNRVMVTNQGCLNPTYYGQLNVRDYRKNCGRDRG